MAVWEYGGSTLQRENLTPPPTWTTAPITVNPLDTLIFRGWFFVINGSGPINLGNLSLERRMDGGAWEDWPGTLRKNVEPGHGFVMAEIVQWTLTFATWMAGSLVEVRLKVDWDGGPWYDQDEEIDCTVQDVVVEEEREPLLALFPARAEASVAQAAPRVHVPSEARTCTMPGESMSGVIGSPAVEAGVPDGTWSGRLRRRARGDVPTLATRRVAVPTTRGEAGAGQTTARGVFDTGARKGVI